MRCEAPKTALEEHLIPVIAAKSSMLDNVKEETGNKFTSLSCLEYSPEGTGPRRVCVGTPSASGGLPGRPSVRAAGLRQRGPGVGEPWGIEKNVGSHSANLLEEINNHS
jgi:hypothetical protein